MGSTLTLTMANCYMSFFEKPIVRQITNSHGLYLRYIGDIFFGDQLAKETFVKTNRKMKSN
jgi:hypothetical protein